MEFFKSKVSRRTFLKRTVYSFLALEVVYVFVNLLKKNNTVIKQENLFEAGNVAFFEKDKVYPFSAGKFYLSRMTDGGFIAVSTKCTHLGCTIQFNNTKDCFLCPCHASSFNKHGEVLSPPATRALDIYPLSIDSNKVFVDLSKPIKRTNFDRSQLTYA